MRQVKTAQRPLLMVDVDGVISLFGFRADRRPPGSFQSIEGIPHFLSTIAAAQLALLAADFDLVWASGWEERSNEHLPALLGLPGQLPFLRFDRAQRAQADGRPGAQAGGRVGAQADRQADGQDDGAGAAEGSLAGHWKLAAIDEHAGERALAWIDDAIDERCERWAAQRAAPTLLVRTEPAVGLTAAETRILTGWAGSL